MCDNEKLLNLKNSLEVGDFVTGRATFFVNTAPSEGDGLPSADFVTQSGAAAHATHSGSGLWRFALDSSEDAPAGSQLFWFAEFEDGAGNVTTTDVRRVDITERRRRGGRFRPGGGE